MVTLALLALASAAPAQEAQYRLRENLGPNINTASDEVLPIIAPDGKTLYFVRKDYPENVGGPVDDIWFSEVQPDGTWGKARNIGAPLNNSGFNFVCTALPDNNTLLLGNNYMADGTQRQGVSTTYRTDGGWSFPVNLYIKNLRNKSKLSEYSMSPDGRVLILSIQPPDSGLGERDLYISFLENGNIWSEPRNLGPKINSAGTDITPFIAADNLTMYFSSNRPGGFGSNDVYMVRRLDETWMNWSEPMNLGWPINTPDWDAYYTIPASGEYAYFVSTTEGFGKSDLFRIILPESVRPTPVLLVSGEVRDVDGKHVPAKIVYERLSDNKQAGTAIANPETGQYTIALPKGHNYGFHAEADGYYPISENIDLSNLAQFDEVKRDLVLAPITLGQTIRLNNIFFDFGKATLRTESIPELDRFVAFLQTRPKLIVEVQGHTDNVGSDDFNLELSRKRATSVAEYITSHGVNSLRVIPRGFGETLPVATNDTDEGRQLNRRVEYKIIEE